MTKQKKKIILIAVVVFFSVVFAGTGIFLGVSYYLNNRIVFTVNDTLPDGQGQKATVILLGGQSNASGCSRDDCLQQKVSHQQYQEYQNGYDNVYINYLSGANQSQEFVKCSTCQGELGGFFGPELGMAQKLNQLYPDQQFFIIKCAWGGTNLFEQWLSPSSKGETGTLYKAFTTFVKTSLKYLKSKNYDIVIEGMCWMQGESDSFCEDIANDYGDNLTNFIEDIRNQFLRYSDPDGMAFVDAYIADNPAYWVYCDIINQNKLTVANSSPLNALVDTIAQGLRCDEEPIDTPDMAHYDSLSQLKLGYLFVEELAKFID